MTNRAILSLVIAVAAGTAGCGQRKEIAVTKANDETANQEPTYASEGVADDGSDLDRNLGDLRVGGPSDGADHCWVFAEFALLHDGNRTDGEWQRKIDAVADRLRLLGWKKSASLLVMALASRGDVMKEWADDLAGCAAWNQPALTDPFVIRLPGGGTVVLKALDIKRDPNNTLTNAAR